MHPKVSSFKRARRSYSPSAADFRASDKVMSLCYNLRQHFWLVQLLDSERRRSRLLRPGSRPTPCYSFRCDLAPHQSPSVPCARCLVTPPLNIACHVRFVVNAGVGCSAMHAEHMEDTGANMSIVQLQAAERAQQRLERENADLKQQLKSIESRYDNSRQVRPLHASSCRFVRLTP